MIDFHTPVPADKPWALTGTKEQRDPNIVNSLYLTPSQLEAIVKDRFKRYELVKAREVLFEEYRMDGAEIVLVAYGATARICKASVDAARADGIPAGLFRPVTLWPFPEKELAAVSEKAGQMLVVEMSMGQMVEDVRLAANGRCPVSFYGRTGGMIPSPGEIAAEIRKLANVKGVD